MNVEIISSKLLYSKHTVHSRCIYCTLNCLLPIFLGCEYRTSVTNVTKQTTKRLKSLPFIQIGRLFGRIATIHAMGHTTTNL